MKPNTYLTGTCIILFLIVILLGVLLGISTNEMNKASDRIDQLIKINKLLDTRGKTEITDLTTTTTTIKTIDNDYIQFIEDYNIAQKTYIELLTGLLKNNGVKFPEFEYEILLEEGK